jgi:hypothetical protein
MQAGHAPKAHAAMAILVPRTIRASTTCTSSSTVTDEHLVQILMLLLVVVPELVLVCMPLHFMISLCTLAVARNDLQYNVLLVVVVLLLLVQVVSAADSPDPFTSGIFGRQVYVVTLFASAMLCRSYARCNPEQLGSVPLLLLLVVLVLLVVVW